MDSPNRQGTPLLTWLSRGLLRRFRRFRSGIASTAEYVVYFTMLREEAAQERADVKFRLARPDEVDWIARSMSSTPERARIIVSQQFAPPDMTVVGINAESGELMYTSWVSYADPALELLGDAQAGDCSIRRAWVPPEARRKGIASAGQVFAAQAAARTSQGRMWSFVLSDNQASLKLHERLAYEEWGCLQLVSRFFRRAARVRKKGRPRWARRATDLVKL